MPISEDQRDDISDSWDFWRYISFEHLASLLRSNELLFRKVSDFPDPYEGSIPKAYAERRDNSYQGDGELPNSFPEVLRTTNRLIRDSVYANCWHRSDRESEAMWQNYGNRGVAIVSDFSSIFSALKAESRTVYMEEVHYLNYYDTYDKLTVLERSELERALRETAKNIFGPIIMKRESFKHEDEFRLLFPDIDLLTEEEYEEVDNNIVTDQNKWKQPLFVHLDGENGALDLRETPKENKTKISVDLDTLINEIRIKPRADQWFKNTVEELVDSLGPKSLTSDRVYASATDLNEISF
jgi:hypothetical protein